MFKEYPLPSASADGYLVIEANGFSHKLFGLKPGSISSLKPLTKVNGKG